MLWDVDEHLSFIDYRDGYMIEDTSDYGMERS